MPDQKPAPCTPAEAASLAKAKADTAEITLAAWLAMAHNAGVTSIRFGVKSDGITIALRGRAENRNVSIDTLAPKGQPFPLYAVAALEAFRRGTDVEQRPDEPARFEVQGTPDEIAACYQPIPLADVPAVLDDEPDDLVRGFATIPGKEQQAAEIAKRAKPVDIHKAPPAGAGQRRPLSVPLCKQCKAQPVYQPTAEFCGAACAKAWFTEHARKAAKGSRS